MSSSAKNNSTAQQNRPHFTKYVIVGGIVLLALGALLFDLSPFGGTLSFYAKWIECGQKPVRTETAPGKGLAWYVSPPDVGIITGLGYSEYFCTPLEAEQAGYSASPDYYHFPHLEKFDQRR